MALSPIPLASESNQLASKPAAQHRLVNLVAEALPDGARSKFYLKSTPGLVASGTLGSGPVLSMAATGGAMFAISGSGAYLRADDGPGTVTSLGSVGTVSQPYLRTTIAIGLLGPVFCVPPNAYVGNFVGGAVQQITTGGGNFPEGGVSSVCYLDGYNIFVSLDGSSFFTSDLLSPTTYSGVSFVKLSSESDFFRHCVAFNHELWLFGAKTISVWYNTGDAVTPFSPRPSGGVIHTGCGAVRSVAEMDGSLWFLGVDGIVYRTVGYQAKRVSTHALEELLANYDSGLYRTISACAFTHEGHSYYALQLPAIGRTFVYDTTTQLWHERSTASGAGHWAINTAVELEARWYFGDSVTGALWSPDSSVATEKGATIQRTAQLPALVTHGPRAFMARLEVEMEVGTNASASPLLLSWSDDGGTTYTTPRSLDTGTTGQTRLRVATTRLGSFRQRVLRLAGSGRVTVYGVDADWGMGDS
jgi:hypothetical protein